MSVHANVITYTKPRPERSYPYLGVRYENSGPLVVLFHTAMLGMILAAGDYSRIGCQARWDEDDFAVFDGKIELSNVKNSSLTKLPGWGICNPTILREKNGTEFCTRHCEN
jgi:hypothetical protein